MQPIGPAHAGLNNPEMAERYLEARYLLRQRSRDSKSAAMAIFQELVARYPNSAESWAGLASAHVFSAGPVDERMLAAEAAAEQAVSIAPNAEAHLRLGDVHSRFFWDAESAEREYKLALSLQPQMVEAHYHYASLLSQLGRHAAAIQSIEQALLLDPIAARLSGDAGWIYLHARDYEKAIDYCERALRLSPALRHAHECLIHAYSLSGDLDSAIAAAREYLPSLGYPETALTLLDGEPGSALKVFWQLYIDALPATLPIHEELPVLRAVAQTALGEYAAALDSIENAVKHRAGLIVYAAVDPRFDSLRQFDRFDQLISEFSPPLTEAQL